MDDAISYLVEKEIIFKKIIDDYGLPIIPSRPEGFETLCKLILEQQVSIESAKACFQKIEKLLKTVSPETIFKSSQEDLRSCGVSRQINASGLTYLAPEKPYWEYNVGVGNIFKVFRLDFTWRGNYRDVPEASNFTIKGSFGFYF